jgi:hypothetical protein
MAHPDCEKSWRINFSRLRREKLEIIKVAKNCCLNAQSYEPAAAHVLLIPPG